MIYHRYRFGILKNIKVWFCRTFGHQINDNPSHHWCERCGLAYEECYFPLDYFFESGILPKAQIGENGNWKRSIRLNEDEVEGENETPIKQRYFEKLVKVGNEETIRLLRRHGKLLTETEILNIKQK